MTMGELIKYHRKELDLSQEELGQMLKPPVNRAAINKWENGTVENIKRTHIQQMAKIFDMSPCELMAFDFKNNSNKLTSEQAELIELFDSLTKEGKQEVIKYATYISSQDKYNVKKESLGVKEIS
ncbi:helix-turn-helix domain-containing protein [Clostridium sp. MCC334]|jgi:transcriptional regulator with XRE-family HTH domain|nr:helix-turn-helix domain-containing protein [Clostridium sp. MCC334]